MKRNLSLISGKLLFTVIALFNAISPFTADWNATHIYSPAWPPHAKFHNAQTMAMAVMLALATLYFAWSRREQRGTVAAVVITAGLYWATQALSFLFPGVAWTDPDLLKAGQSLTDFPMQLKLDLVMVPVIGAAAWLLLRGRRHRNDSDAAQA